MQWLTVDYHLLHEMDWFQCFQIPSVTVSLPTAVIVVTIWWDRTHACVKQMESGQWKHT